MSASGATAPMFSYAQAAKGLTPSTQNTSTTVSSTSSEHGGKDAGTSADASTNHTKPKSVAASPEAQPDTNLSNGKSVKNKLDDGEAQEVVTGIPGAEAVEEGEKATIDNADVKPATPRKASNPVSTISAVDSEDKVSDQALEKSTLLSESDKNKETDDDWDKVSIPSVAAEKELKAAPIPTVNIWQQRKELQDAKLKEQRQSSPSTMAKPKSQALPARDDTKRKQPTKDAIADRESATQRRTNSGARSNNPERVEKSPSHNSPRSQSKVDEKNSSAIPAAGDAETWPTPESALVDERRRSTTQDKVEKSDAKNANSKKWVQMPFVPSAKFETPLPPAATARRGGRAGNRGRDSTNRGGHSALHQNNEKNESGTMGPPPVPNKNFDQDRGRKPEGAQNQRANSMPDQARRPTSSGSSAGYRKTSAVQVNDSEENTKLSTSSRRYTPPTAADVSNIINGSRSSSQQPTLTQVVGYQQGVGTSVAIHNQGGFEPEALPQTSMVSERHRGSSRDEYRSSTEFGETFVPSGRDWTRGKHDTTREKPDSWRERREPRAERTRGSGYRGRGSHSAYNGNAHYTAPLPQNGFENARQYSGEGRSRQASQPFTQSQQFQNSRPHPRSQSAISVTPGPNYTPMQGYPQMISPIQGDVSYGVYPSQMPSGIMNEMPYANSLNSMALISMVVTQT